MSGQVYGRFLQSGGVLKPDSSAAEDEPIASCREQLVSLEFLCFVDVVDMLPRNLARAIM